MEDRWEDAYGVLWTAYDRSAPADRPVLLSMRIRCELQRVAPTESIKLLRRYVDADPQDWEAQRTLANVEMALGHGAEAVREMRACLEGRPDDSRTWRDYLTMLQSLGDLDAFNTALERLPKSADEEPETGSFAAQAHERNGDSAGAAENYRQALQLNPNLRHRSLSPGDDRGTPGPSPGSRRPPEAWQEISRRPRKARPGLLGLLCRVRSTCPGPPRRRQEARLDLRDNRLAPGRGGLEPVRGHPVSTRDAMRKRP